MNKKWTIKLNGAPNNGGTDVDRMLWSWVRTKAWVDKNGGCAQLIIDRSMVIEEYRKEVSNA